ncbi:islet cell autoantigen 1-like isoform X2 [Convolutriloba macropyga]|uniref:islet cell autoantigen 1-like isoform X2 n=1 Tax=Convolutriloba macropyga TaxID=536237 RepID=UPI003F528E78
MEDEYDDPYLRESYKHYTQELLHDQSMTSQLTNKYWTAKSFVKKLKKKEDQSVVAADSDLDAKLEFYKSIQETTQKLVFCIERYQDAIMALSQEENKLGRFLKEQSQVDKSPAGKMMNAIGKQLSQTSQQRLSCRVPLVRLYGDLDTFRNRAISDTNLNVQKMEALRTEYRGTLMWMKDISQELNPDAYRQLEKFRKVQAQVKINRDKFERHKYAVCQKIDLLGASRCNLLSHDLEVYHQNMLAFWQKTAKEMSEICEQFKGHQHYEWSMLKELNEPSLKLHEQLEKNMKVDDKAQSTEDPTLAPQDGPAATLDKRSSIDDEKLISWDDHLSSQGNGGGDDDKYFHSDTAADDNFFDDAENASFFNDLMMGTNSGELNGGGSLNSDWTQMFSQGAQQGQQTTQQGQEQTQSQSEQFSASEHFGLFADPASMNPQSTAEPGSSFLPSQLMDMSNLDNFQSMLAAAPPFNASGPGSVGGNPGFSLNPFQQMPGRGANGVFGAGSPGPSGQVGGSFLSGVGGSSAATSSSSKGNQQSARQSKTALQDKSTKADMSAWFNLFADLDPLGNPDAVGNNKDQQGEKIGI